MYITFYYPRMDIYDDDDRYLIDLEGHWALMILFFMELGNNNNNMYIHPDDIQVICLNVDLLK